MENLTDAGTLPGTSNIELTKKGEEYCRLAEACGVSFITITTDDPKSIGDAIERLLGMLDAMEPDPDLEPWLGASENHPRITWTVTADDSGSQLENWSQAGDDREGEHDERELDNADYEETLGWTNQRGEWGCQHPDMDECEEVSEDEGASTGDEEYSLGWQDEGNQELLSMWGDYEADLSWTEEVDQVRRLEVSPDWLCIDGEPSLGFVGHGTGWRKGEGTDDREDDGDDREPNGDEADYSCPEDYWGNRGVGGDGSGHQIAKKMLRKVAERTVSPPQPFKSDDFDKMPWA